MSKRDNQKQFMLWIDKDVLKTLKQIALDKDTNVAEIIRIAVGKEIKNQEV